MRFVGKPEVRARLEDKTIAIVGSGPGVLDNGWGLIDSHDVVIRVNNYRLNLATGFRTDVFYSFFGNSIRKTAVELRRDGVTLCLCKCPNAPAIESDWHRQRNKLAGVDFRWIYHNRAAFWFCDTYVPPVGDFLAHFRLLGGHVPTTGFAAILDVLSFQPRHLYLTGFDFFRSGIHNVSEPWREKNLDDPIGHVPERELEWLAKNARTLPISADAKLTLAMASVTEQAA